MKISVSISAFLHIALICGLLFMPDMSRSHPPAFIAIQITQEPKPNPKPPEPEKKKEPEKQVKPPEPEPKPEPEKPKTQPKKPIERKKRSIVSST